MANLRVDNLTGTGGRNAITGSVAFTSSSGYLSVTSDTIGTSAFTIEWWFKPQDRAEPGTANRRVFRLGANNATGGMSINYDAVNNDIQWNYNAATILAASTIKVYDNSWYHIAAVREGTGSNATKLYINGVLSDTVTLSTDFTQTALQIGWDSTLGDDFGFYGNISNLRVTKRALYTAAFTPPTEKLTGVTDTILLCCQDSDDPTQEATGKTITAYGGFRQDKTEGNLLINTLDWTGAASSYSTTMPASWTAGNGAQVQYETGGTSGGGANRMLRLRNDGSSSYIYQTIPTVIGQKYQIDLWYEAQNSSLAVKWSAGTSAAGSQNGSSQWNVGSDGTKATRTGSFNATSTTTYITFQIISGTNDASVFIDDIQVRAFNPKAPKDFPPVGIDEGIVLEGETTFNSPNYMYFPTGDTSQRSRGRAVIFGGVTTTPNYLTSISYYNISNFSSAHDFGDMRAAGGWMTACSSSTRGLAIGAGNGGGATNVVDYVEIATTGNGKDFGDLTEEKNYYGAASNQTRALRGGGYGTGSDVIDYATIATIGNFADFGNLTQGRLTHEGGLSSSTRAVWGGGTFYNPNVVYHNTIDYITIATTGNATDFGDMTVNRKAMAAVSSSTRGIWSGGYTPTYQNVKDYITIATTGNATDFGDSLWAGAYKSGTSNGTRGVWSGGRSAPASNANRTNLIEYVTIATTGDGTDFGDLDVRRDGPGACSDSHGGL